VTLTLTQIRELLAAHHVRPSKALGQHFLADPNTAERIVRLAGVRPRDRVVEVGPGVGSLTTALLDAGAHVCAIELDRHVLPVLRAVTAARDMELVEADVLTVDWPGVLGDGVWSMVANLPYNIATPMLLRALESAPTISRFVVTVQREVGERLVAAPGTRAYGAVSVKVAYDATGRIVGRVPRTVFFPEPNVDSVIVELTRHTAPPVAAERERLFELLNAGFATRRKMLRRSLAGVVSDDAFASARVDPRARAETLSLHDWARLADAC
jgi:16S rRNA (adenine1518-N6/adenine1519-N6)-dimethyltransferase